MANSGLIFIPDISGFTKFVTQTEIKHSNHIISELIELLLESNKSFLRISEIEGDAVLFYKLDKLPAFDELWKLIKKMFLDFHSYLKIIERDRVCQCGACSSASDLSLKFIVHCGVFNEVPIQSFTKLMGKDVILAHRLLKNEIRTNEYALFTDAYLTENPLLLTPDEHWAKPVEHYQSYENFGEIKSQYIDLSQFRAEVPQAPEVKTKSGMSGPPNFTVQIKAKPLLVHSIITDHTLKPLIDPKVKGTKGFEINRLNGSHTCVFDDLEIHFVTTGNGVSEKEINYSERADIGIGFTFTTDFKIVEKNGETEMSVRIRPDKTDRQLNNPIKRFFTNLKLKFITARIIAQTKKGMNKLVDFIENEALKESAT